MIIVRKMEPSEAEIVQRIGRKAFKGVEALFVSKPREAMVAVMDDKIVGGIILTYLHAKNVKIGYFDAAFVDPAYHGQGIGGILYEKTTQYLWSQGCTALTAAVKDDNAGSWKAFLRCGLQRTTLTEALRLLGLPAMLKQYFLTPFFICNGMELYAAVKEGSITPKRENTAKYMFLYLLLNLLLMAPAFLSAGKNYLSYLSAYLFLLIGGMLTSFAGTLFSKRNWKFRLNSGGAVIVAFINLLGTAFPMIGNWYPSDYDNTKEFKKSLGIPALLEWIFHIFTVILSLMLYQTHSFFRSTASLGMVFLLYRIIAVYPFESFGGRRVFCWNKIIYAVLAIASVAVFYAGFRI